MGYFDTPETDAYNGTHETHRIKGRTIYDHARCMEWQRNSARREAEAVRDAVMKWAKENGADLSDLAFVFMWESEVRLSEANEKSAGTDAREKTP